MTGSIRTAASQAALAIALLSGCGAAAPVLAQAVPAAPVATATPPTSADDFPPPEEAKAAPDINPVAITTLATGTKLSFDKLGQPVTVITQDDLDRLQGGNFTRVIAAMPGATWDRQGGPGAQTGLHLRGAGADDVLVMIDGVRMQDVGAPGGGFDFGTLTAAGVARVDILRGTNSVVWGSGAIGGVVALTTRETKGIVATAEVGGHDSVLGNIAIGINKDRYALALDGGYIATDGTDGAAREAPGGFHQWRLGARGRISLTDALSLTATARFADTKLTGDAFALPPDLTGAIPQGLRTQQTSGRIAAHFEHGAITLDSGYALSSTRRAYDVDPATGSPAQTSSRGTSERIDLTGAVQLPAGFMVNFGADDEATRAISSDGTARRARLDSGHVVLGWSDPMIALSVSARIDDHNQYGTHDSLSASASVKLREGLRLRGSYGDGYKVPSLYQLYAQYGNPALKPETAQSYDLGIDYSQDDGRVRLSASVYHRDSRNLIDLTGCATPAITASPACHYANIGAARADGAELEAGLVRSARWRLSALVSYDRATNRSAGDPDRGKAVARRPNLAVTTSVDWTSPFIGIVLGADLRVQSASWDDPANTVRLQASELTTLRASLPFGNFLDLYARIENLFNDHHPTAAGYGTVGREILVGARVRY